MTVPPLSRDATSPATIGVDVGGTKVRAGLLDADGRVLAEATRVSTSAPGDICVDLVNALAAAARTSDVEVSDIGIGLPELVSPTGRVMSATVIRWSGDAVADALASIAPVRVEADVRCAAVAEATLGAGVGRESFLYVSVGTGISGCLVIGGTPWPGARGNALVLGSGMGIGYTDEFGELPVLPVEQVASGPALVRRYLRASGEEVARAEHVLERGERGDVVALNTIRVGARVLAARISQTVNLLDPASVVVGGGLGSATGPYWDALHPTLRLLIWSEQTRHLPIEQAKLGGAAGMIGAALLARAAGD